MKTKILVAALACLSMAAVAQQSSSEQKPSPKASQATSAREAASGKATGKTTAQDDWHQQSAASSSDAQLKPVSSQSGQPASDDATMVRESPTKASSGLRESPTKASTGLRESPTKASTGSLRESPTKQSVQVSVGDVNGDGSPDKAASSSSHTTVQPRDAASGMPTGKRQHNPISVTKEVDKASPKQ
jgi:hypothetical protein